jgi:hypothetical protein
VITKKLKILNLTGPKIRGAHTYSFIGLYFFMFNILFDKITANVLALGAVADFGAQNCQYTTKVDAR